MDTCAKCGAGLGVGRFCVNCGHQVGAPVPTAPAAPPVPDPREHGLVPIERPRQLRVRRRRSPELGGAEERRAASPQAWLVGDGDADDRDVEDGPARLNWAAWVLAALALVCAVLLALSFLGDDDTVTDQPGGATATTGQAGASGDAGREGEDGAATPTGPAVDLARGARVQVPATAPPTTDLDGSRVSYEAERMVDGARRTAWRMRGDGTGAEITIHLDRQAVISEVGLVNGYARRVAGVDWYPHNRRILGVTWTFDDGRSVEQVLEERRGLQRMDVEPVRTRTVTLTLTRVTIPGSGGLGRDYTPISTLVLMGHPAD